jgi:hypothetical protein
MSGLNGFSLRRFRSLSILNFEGLYNTFTLSKSSFTIFAFNQVQISTYKFNQSMINTYKVRLQTLGYTVIFVIFIKIKIFIVMFVLVMNNDYILLTVPMALVTEHPIASAGVSGCVCVAGGMGVLQYEKHDLGSEWVSC